MRHRWIIALVVTVGLTTATAVAYAASSGRSTPSAAQRSAQIAARRARLSELRSHLLAVIKESRASVPVAMQAHFVTLRDRRGGNRARPAEAGGIAIASVAPAALPLAVLRQDESPASQRNELDFDRVQAIATGSGTLAWLIPGLGGACLIVSSGGGACAMGSVLDTHGLITYTYVPGVGAVYVGMVPATNASLTFVGPSGNQVPLTVADGVFVVPASQIRTFNVRTVSGTLESWSPPPPPPISAAFPATPATGTRLSPPPNCGSETLLEQIDRGNACVRWGLGSAIARPR